MRKKKVCFISLGNLYLCPYISKYISLIDCDYDVIYWNRHGIDEDIGAKNTYSFNHKMDEGVSKASKLLGYFKFRKHALNIVKKNDYDGLILLQTSVGILLQTILRRKYKGKYILDIRDYTMENNFVFYSLVKSLVRNSAYSVISSKGYEKFLPKHDYVLVHNDTHIEPDIVKKFEQKERNKDKIVISYIGLIRFHEQNKKVIMKFKNDQRFLLRFIGKGALALSEFCKKNDVNNVELIDRFPPEKTLDYYYETDIIYNLYGNNTPLLDYALSNKLYYAAKLKIPILVCEGTEMEKITKKYGFGYTFKIDDIGACDDLFNYYNTINWIEFKSCCEAFLEQIYNDNKLFNEKIRNFVKQI